MADPFFEQLKADIQKGIDDADRGALIDEAEAWKHLYAVIDEIEQSLDVSDRPRSIRWSRQRCEFGWTENRRQDARPYRFSAAPLQR